MSKTQEDLSMLAAANTEIARLQKLVEHYQAPFRRAERLVHTLRNPDAKSGAASPSDSQVAIALVMEQAKSSTFSEASQMAAAELEKMISLVAEGLRPAPEALQAAQEAVDLIAHLNTLWPNDESKN